MYYFVNNFKIKVHFSSEHDDPVSVLFTSNLHKVVTLIFYGEKWTGIVDEHNSEVLVIDHNQICTYLLRLSCEHFFHFNHQKWKMWSWLQFTIFILVRRFWSKIVFTSQSQLNKYNRNISNIDKFKINFDQNINFSKIIFILIHDQTFSCYEKY